MPERRSTVRVDCEEVQGAESYVLLRKITVADHRELRKPEVTFDSGGKEILARLILGWNWVWEDGSPMPLPSADPTVMDRLTDHEAGFLWEKVWQISVPSKEQLGNSDPSS